MFFEVICWGRKKNIYLLFCYVEMVILNFVRRNRIISLIIEFFCNIEIKKLKNYN